MQTASHIARNLTTIIRMGAAAFSVTSHDAASGEHVSIDLSGADYMDRERVATALCQLHGIGTRKQWANLQKARYADHAAFNKARKERYRNKRKGGPKPGAMASVEARPLALPMGV